MEQWSPEVPIACWEAPGALPLLGYQTERSAQWAHIPGYTSLDNDAQPPVTFSCTHFVTKYSPVRIQNVLSRNKGQNRAG